MMPVSVITGQLQVKETSLPSELSAMGAGIFIRGRREAKWRKNTGNLGVLWDSEKRNEYMAIVEIREREEAI